MGVPAHAAPPFQLPQWVTPMANIILPDPFDGKPSEPHKRKAAVQKLQQERNEAARKARLREVSAKREARNFALAREKAQKEGPLDRLCGSMLNALGIPFTTRAVLYGAVPDFLLPGKIVLQLRTPEPRQAKRWEGARYKWAKLDKEKLTSKDGLIYLREVLVSLGLKV